jgi:TatD DNase family protein
LSRVELAVELRKPLFLHERGAFEQFVGVLRPVHDADTLPPCVIHAFTGSEEELRAYRSMYFFIGVTGGACPLPDYLPNHAPLSRLMIETDAPYLGFKGCRFGASLGERKTHPGPHNRLIVSRYWCCPMYESGQSWVGSWVGMHP